MKPLQHEDPNADQEQTARIGGRLVESGFGRLQYEDAMEHAQRGQREGIQNMDDIGQAEEIIEDMLPDHPARSDPTSTSASQESAQPGELRMTWAEHQLIPTGQAEGTNPTHTGRTHLAELEQDPTLTQPGVDDTQDLPYSDRTRVADAEAAKASELCPTLELEPAQRRGLHLQNEAAQIAAEVAELDHAQV